MFESVEKIVMKEEKSNKTKLVLFRLTPNEYANLKAKRGRTTCQKLTLITARILFHGSELGKQYSAKRIAERCIEDHFALHQQKSQRWRI
jgi:hypothetical protein